MTGISTYYAFGAADHLPEFKLSTIQGNADEGIDINLSGSYSGRIRSEFLTVSAKGSDYRSRKSVYEKNIASVREWYLQNPDIKQLVDDHPNFMRGKGEITGLYKDEEWIIYAEASVSKKAASRSEVILDVELLNLKSGKVTRYETAAEGKKAYAFMNIRDVQRVDDQLHIVTFQHPASVPPDEIYDYVMDLQSGKLIRDEMLTRGIEPKKDVKLNFGYITKENLSAPGEHALLKVNEEKVNRSGNHPDAGTIVTEHLYLYSYKTGKLTALPDSLTSGNLAMASSYSLKDDILSILRNDKQSLTWLQYNLVTGKVEKEASSMTAQQLGADEIQWSFIRNNRIYISFNQSGIPSVAVVNAANGALLY